jgi:trk system potassium uptake protein TrkA
MGIKAKIIEINLRRCEDLSVQLPSALIINGDGSDDDLLQSEHVSEMDAFISATGHDEDNLMSALLAKQTGVSKVVAKISRITYTGIIKNMGIDNIVNPKLITANSIVRFVRGLGNALGNPVHTLYKIVDNQAEALEFVVGGNARLLDIPLKSLRIKKGILIAVITRKGETIIPHGNDKIQAGDSVILFAKGMRLKDLNDILEDVE